MRAAGGRERADAARGAAYVGELARSAVHERELRRRAVARWDSNGVWRALAIEIL